MFVWGPMSASDFASATLAAVCFDQCRFTARHPALHISPGTGERTTFLWVFKQLLCEGAAQAVPDHGSHALRCARAGALLGPQRGQALFTGTLSLPLAVPSPAPQAQRITLEQIRQHPWFQVNLPRECQVGGHAFLR